MAVRETANATKERIGKSELARLFGDASRIVVSKGKKVTSLDPRKASRNELADAVLGPTGNLRAPTIRAGKTFFVGFSEDTYAEHFG